MRILIAEDNIFTATQYKRVLEKYGHTANIALDGEECYMLYSQNFLDGDEFDLVMVDSNMPKQNGLDTIFKIINTKADQKIIYTPLAGHDEPQNDHWIHSKQNIAIIAKPFSLNYLMNRINGLVEIQTQ